MSTLKTDEQKTVSTTLRVENATPAVIKRKERLKIEWPKDKKFLIQDMLDKYGEKGEGHPNITVRHRIRRAKEVNELVEVGATFGNLGRPQLFFVHRNYLEQYRKENPEQTILS